MTHPYRSPPSSNEATLCNQKVSGAEETKRLTVKYGLITFSSLHTKHSFRPVNIIIRTEQSVPFLSVFLSNGLL